MKICILTPTLVPNDAIGNDVRHHCQLLSNYYQASIYAPNYKKDSFEKFIINRKELNNILEDYRNIIIYHHGVLWEEGLEIIRDAKCQVYIKYHNITTPKFFEPYNNFYTHMCQEGIIQTKKIIETYNVKKYICDSNFNAKDLIELGITQDNIEIVAPFHKLEDFNNTPPHIELVNELLDGKINLLFVGRFAPNKGHRHLIEIVNKYIEIFGDNIRLNIVGGLDEGLSGYIDEIKALIIKYNLDKYINILDKISFSKIHTYFNYSHFFILMSEHEGFCVPILEAQMHDLPIIAYDTTAISETLGQEQLIFKKLDYEELATAINILHNYPEYRNYIIEKGQENLLKYEKNSNCYTKI